MKTDLTMTEEHVSSVLENRVLRNVFGPKKRDGEQEIGEKFHYGGFLICILHHILFGSSN